MGYGHSEHTGRNNDGGIDGIIYQNPLGLDRVYIQAKRYTDHPVSDPDIRNFIGSLDTRNASKGVFITTSDFTAAARQTTANTSKLILPVNGPELARLMMHHKVGVITQRTYEIQQTDENYFVPE